MYSSTLLGVMVVRSIGWLKTAMSLLLIGMLAWLPGLNEISVGGEIDVACTVNPAGTVSTSALVVTTTVRGPSVAAGSIASDAERVHVPVTVTSPAAPSAAPTTEMPGPKLAVVVPLTQLVYWPAMLTVTKAFGVPIFGLMTVMEGVPGNTVNPLARFRFSELVVTLTVRAPTGAFVAIVMFAVSCVGPETVMKLVVIPYPKLTDEIACAKLEKAPVRTTLSVVPAAPVPGVAEMRFGTPASTENPPVILAN